MISPGSTEKTEEGITVINKIAALAALASLLQGCDKSSEDDGSAPYASRYQPLASEATLLSGATVLLGNGERIDDADVLIADGKIVEVGTELSSGDATVDRCAFLGTATEVNTANHGGLLVAAGLKYLT